MVRFFDLIVCLIVLFVRSSTVAACRVRLLRKAAPNLTRSFRRGVRTNMSPRRNETPQI